jgi:hypothetical protein
MIEWRAVHVTPRGREPQANEHSTDTSLGFVTASPHSPHSNQHQHQQHLHLCTLTLTLHAPAGGQPFGGRMDRPPSKAAPGPATGPRASLPPRHGPPHPTTAPLHHALARPRLLHPHPSLIPSPLPTHAPHRTPPSPSTSTPTPCALRHSMLHPHTSFPSH